MISECVILPNFERHSYCAYRFRACTDEEAASPSISTVVFKMVKINRDGSPLSDDERDIAWREAYLLSSSRGIKPLKWINTILTEYRVKLLGEIVNTQLAMHQKPVRCDMISVLLADDIVDETIADAHTHYPIPYSMLELYERGMGQQLRI